MFSNQTAEDAAAQRNAGLQQGYNQLSDQYGQGRSAINTGYGTATNLYNNLAGSTGAGATAYGNASGANGAAGLQSATQNFQNSGQYGAYGFARDQGLQALDRTHAAAGNLNSGNADTDAMKYASGLAGQQYNNYLQGLSPYLNANSNAVAGQANAATGQANQLNTSNMAQGNAANTTQSNIGATNAAATMNKYNVGNNILGALGQGIGAFTGMGGLGGLFSGFTGGANGGTASNPLSGLSPSDYGTGSNAGNLFNQYGL